MTEKFTPQKADSSIYYYLFSKSGFSNEVKAEAEKMGMELVEAHELLADDV